MQSIDEFTPSTTEPVFGSGLISQSRSQPATKNDISDNEKMVPPVESVVNGQNDLISPNENAPKETIATNMDSGDSTAVHVSSQSEKLSDEIANEIKPAEEPVSTLESMATELSDGDKPTEQTILTSELMIMEQITGDKAAEEPISASEIMITEQITEDKPAEEPISASEIMITEQITEDKPAEEPISASELMIIEQTTEDKPAEEPFSMAKEQLTQVKSAEEPISTEQPSQSEPPGLIGEREPLIVKAVDTGNEDSSSKPTTDVDTARDFVPVEVITTTNITVNDNVPDVSTTIESKEIQFKSKVNIEIWNCRCFLVFFFFLNFIFKL